MASFHSSQGERHSRCGSRVEVGQVVDSQQHGRAVRCGPQCRQERSADNAFVECLRAAAWPGDSIQRHDFQSPPLNIRQGRQGHGRDPAHQVGQADPRQPGLRSGRSRDQHKVAGNTSLRNDRLPDRRLPDPRLAGQQDRGTGIPRSVERGQNRGPLRGAADEIRGVSCHATAPTRTFGGSPLRRGRLRWRAVSVRLRRCRPDRGFAPIPPLCPRLTVDTSTPTDRAGGQPCRSEPRRQPQPSWQLPWLRPPATQRRKRSPPVRHQRTPPPPPPPPPPTPSPPRPQHRRPQLRQPRHPRLSRSLRAGRPPAPVPVLLPRRRRRLRRRPPGAAQSTSAHS